LKNGEQKMVPVLPQNGAGLMVARATTPEFSIHTQRKDSNKRALGTAPNNI